jgi:hypothetical protein
MATDLDPDTVQRQYQAAKAKLLPICVSGSATDEQKAAARRALDDLNRDFIDSAVSSVEARTEQFESFIERMELAISELGQSSLLPGLDELQGVVNQAVTLVATVRQADAGGTG